MTFVGDNATSNDRQTARLHRLPNAFESINRVRCFNHTMQLSVKALLRLFTSPTSTASPDETLTAQPDDDDLDGNDDDPPTLHELNGDDGSDSDSNDDDNDTDEEDSDNEGGLNAKASRIDAEVDGIFDGLAEEEREHLLDNTAAVRTTLDKVSSSFYYIPVLTNLFNYQGSQTIVCDCPFYYNCTSGLACGVCRS